MREYLTYRAEVSKRVRFILVDVEVSSVLT